MNLGPGFLFLQRSLKCFLDVPELVFVVNMKTFSACANLSYGLICQIRNMLHISV